MLRLEAKHIELSIGDRRLFHLESLSVYDQDRIGIVGANGSGKTTLMRVLAGQLKPDGGFARISGSSAYIPQLSEPQPAVDAPVDAERARAFGVYGVNPATMSGGEKTRLRIAESLSGGCHVLFADEPTSNLDMDGITLLENELRAFKGALILISHDRALLDALCNRIVEIENGIATEFPGNYSDYKAQKKAAVERGQLEYELYTKERKRLERAAMDASEHAKTMRKTPARMGNSEARLHKRGVQSRKAKVESQVKAIRSRIEQLEAKEKPRDLPKTQIDMPEHLQLHCRTVISGRSVNRSFGSRVLFRELSFQLPNRTKTALLGPNGCGKSTLIEMILQGAPGIEVAQKVKIGYFSQQIAALDESRTVLEHVLETSILPDEQVRTLLARLLFRRDDVYKPIGVLSGGERVKTAFARLFAGEYNMVILDEPTNYLDIPSMEALEAVLADYEGTLLFVSHDRSFVDQIAGRILLFNSGRLLSFDGNYSAYLAHLERQAAKPDEASAEMLMQLENRLNELVGRLSVPGKGDDVAALDEEYRRTLKELKELRN